MVDETLKMIYGQVDNLSNFTHPVYKKNYTFLTDQQILEYAKTLVEKIKKSAVSQIVVSETGASPFAWVCQKLLEKEDIYLDWLYIKFPREPKQQLAQLIMFYLSEEEKSERVQGTGFTRSELLDTLAGAVSLEIRTPEPESLEDILNKENLSKQNELQKAVAKICKDTEIAKVLGRKFLYFDEYIDSGTTLRNALMYFNFFSQSVDMQCISYYINVHDANERKNVFHTLFDLDSREACFEEGAYPFENRVDLIGYFYHFATNEMRKIALKDFIEKYQNENAKLESFILSIKNAIHESEILSIVREKATIQVVKEFISENLIFQYILFFLENELYSDSDEAEFLWLLWDMYGPIWSPMPDEYHFDFWKAFEDVRKEMRKLAEEHDLFIEYNKVRKTLMKQLALVCSERRAEWQKNILGLINNYD